MKIIVYPTSDERRKFVEVKSTEIKITGYEEFSFFIARSWASRGYYVYEKNTGMPLVMRIIAKKELPDAEKIILKGFSDRKVTKELITDKMNWCLKNFGRANEE